MVKHLQCKGMELILEGFLSRNVKLIIFIKALTLIILLKLVYHLSCKAV